jgi:hypothetical protein
MHNTELMCICRKKSKLESCASVLLCGVNPECKTDNTSLNIDGLQPVGVMQQPKTPDSSMHCGENLKKHKGKKGPYISTSQFRAIYKISTFLPARFYSHYI